MRLTLGDREEELTLEGESSLPYRPETSREYIPCEQSFEDQDIPIYFSTDCINVSHIATHSHVVKIIMIHNNLMHDVLAYEWKRFAWIKLYGLWNKLLNWKLFSELN